MVDSGSRDHPPLLWLVQVWGQKEHIPGSLVSRIKETNGTVRTEQHERCLMVFSESNLLC